MTTDVSRVLDIMEAEKSLSMAKVLKVLRKLGPVWKYLVEISMAHNKSKPWRNSLGNTV